MLQDELTALFEQALALPGEERDAFVHEVCERDAALRDELVSLLDAHAKAEVYFSKLAHSLVPGPPGAERAVQEGRTQDDTSDLRIGQQLRHYHITGKLGAGGMGVVYLAEDTRLHRAVALKFLPDAVWSDDVAQARFFSEAQAAAKLNHPNICTIYQIDEVDGQWFIAMEYVEGETLRNRMEKGPLPSDEVVRIARQIVAGLAEAHASGIVHRDIKPGNVMLTPKGDVKLLDFGLAKVANLNLTRPGTMMGTLAYMSPEQLRGEEVDARSDLWSMGVLLYEMLAGHRPFLAEYEQAMMYQVLYETPLPLQESQPTAPAHLVRIVEGCLERDPTQRMASAKALLAALSAHDNASPTALQDAPPSLPPAWSHHRSRILMGLAGALVVVLLWLLVPVLRPMLWGDGDAEVPRIYVAVLASGSDVPAHQALADGLVQSVSSVLGSFEAARESMWVIPASEVQAHGVTSAAQARDLFGVNQVVRVVVHEEAEDVLISLDLEDAVNPRVLDSAEIPQPSAATFHDDLLGALTRLFNFTATPAMALALPAVDPEAYAYYVQGIGYLRRFHEPGNVDYAITLFREALNKDSTYARAHAGLCEATWEKYDDSRDAVLALQALQSCEDAARLGGSEPEVLVALGSIYMQQGELDRAEQVLIRARALDPTNTEALRWLGRVYEDRADHEGAEAAYREAIALKPHVWVNHYELAVMYDLVGRPADALAEYETILRLTPDNYLAYTGLGNYYRDREQFGQAEQHYRRAIQLNPTSLSHRNLGRLYLLDVKHPQALAEFETALAISSSDMVAWTWLADAAYWSGDEARATEAWQTVLNLALARLRVNSRDNIAIVLAADAQAGLGATEQGRTSLLQAVALPQEDLQLRFMIGRTYERLGQRALAYQWIGKAMQEGLTDVFVRRDLWLADFRNDPLYASLQLDP